MANGGGRDLRRDKAAGGLGQRRASKQDTRTPRSQSSGSVAGPAVDMDGLREAVGQATAGTGEVRRAITTATFQPRAAAFTSLIQQCARAKNWQKALEVFETMKEYPAVKANYITYSALISACSSCGRWQEAEAQFEDMLAASRSDTDCAPNTITYSSLITACVRGGHLDRAVVWYRKMQESGVEADFIIYSALLSACERDLDQALRFVDDMHSSGYSHSPDFYAKLLERCGKAGRWEDAVQLFLELQAAGTEATKAVCLALLAALEACGQARPALQLLDALSQAGNGPDRETQVAALRVCAKAGAWNAAVRIWEKLQGRGNPGATPPDGAAAELVVEACRAGDNAQKALELTAQFSRAGLIGGRPGGSRPGSAAASRSPSMASSSR
ncbi:g1614 [Coccomyxa elongata]